MMQHVRSLTACALCLVAAAAAGCGGDDDDDDSSDGGGVPDSGSGTEADAAGEADAAAGEVGLDSPYGGEIHVERIESGAGVFPPLTHADAFFIRDQTPAISRMPTPGTCFDAKAEGLWPVAQAEEAEYIDVGSVTVSGGPQDLLLSQTEPGTDLLGRVHDIVYLHIVTDADQYVTADTDYTVEVSGSDAYPAGTYGPIHVSGPITPVSPGPETTLITIASGQPFTASLAPDTSAPEGVVVQNFLIVQPPMGGADLVCLGENADDGEFTLSAEQVGAIPPAGNILRGHLTHRVVEFDDGKGASGRRLDLIGVNCLATPYQVK